MEDQGGNGNGNQTQHEYKFAKEKGHRQHIGISGLIVAPPLMDVRNA